MVVTEENVSFFKKCTLKYGGWMTLFLTPHKEKEIEKSAFEWRIDYNTKTKEDTKVRTIYNLEKIF